MAGMDCSKTADYAVQWAAHSAEPYSADPFIVRVISHQHPSTTEFGAAECPRAVAAKDEFRNFVGQIAGEFGHAFAVVDRDPAWAISPAANFRTSSLVEMIRRTASYAHDQSAHRRSVRER
ncbi:MAG: hypothetical protein A4E19_11945 [Nitrospira sp. SG-bin1]|nr:MAG: hypothetical protein A4E19_11945 [Nitrospira sp. SG-bin1]